MNLGAFARISPISCRQSSLCLGRRAMWLGMDELDKLGDVRNAPHVTTLRRGDSNSSVDGRARLGASGSTGERVLSLDGRGDGRLDRVTPEHSNRQLAVVQRRLDAAAEPGGEVELPFVAAVLPFVK